MQRTRFSRTMPRVFPSLLAFAFLTYLAINHRLHGQTAAAENIVVTAEEAGSAYGAPPSFSRSRLSPTTTAYVLPPWTVYTSAIYEGDALRFNRPDHQFTQEVELGLPHRFGLAVENSVEAFRGTTQERSFSIEARYAFADWNKILLNPTIFAEWKFGIGHILHDEGPPEPMPKGEAEEFLNERNPLPDAYEVRLLLAQDFYEKVEWAFNAFFEQEVTGDRGREYGFAQTAVVPLLPNERLKAGVEMQLTAFTDKGIRGNPSYRFILGPTISWKPSSNTRFDVSPLFGVTADAPRASVFAVFWSGLIGAAGARRCGNLLATLA
ncbi:MAG: hypothetical protein DMF03_01480 [Verrucomicrobia bacterium]|nr:MAG: hypothetical protein DMF03_01480 [Verrucomicrobiota bacterium]